MLVVDEANGYASSSETANDAKAGEVAADHDGAWSIAFR
jgi:hypothetical protein